MSYTLDAGHQIPALEQLPMTLLRTHHVEISTVTCTHVVTYKMASSQVALHVAVAHPSSALPEELQ